MNNIGFGDEGFEFLFEEDFDIGGKKHFGNLKSNKNDKNRIFLMKIGSEMKSSFNLWQKAKGLNLNLNLPKFKKHMVDTGIEPDPNKRFYGD